MQWTEEQINALAPNDSTERRARQLAIPSKWQQLGTNGTGIWGRCTGSGNQPYQVQIALQGPRFKCSCPVRKLPCKHSLALLYLYAKNPALFEVVPPDNSIAQWLDKSKPTTTTIAQDTEAAAKAAKAKERRWQQRLTLMENGLNELEQWLRDLVRQGIANTEATQKSFWDQVAAKMVDAKLPSVGTYLKETHRTLQTEQDWAEPVMMRLGVLYSWVLAFRQRDQLSNDLKQALYTRLGRTTQKSQVIAAGHHMTDVWLVAAIWEDEDLEGRAFRKVWLWGTKTQQWALLLDFSFGGVAYEQSYPLGSLWQGTLAFYDNAHRQRATWVQQKPAQLPHLVPSIATVDLAEHLDQYAEARQNNPWLSTVATAIGNLRAQLNVQKQLVLTDGTAILPCQGLSEALQWSLLSISGGGPISLVGEWNGQYFLPLSWLDELGCPQALY